MSRLTNWFVNTFGGDKVMHFLGGAWITSILSVYGWYGIIAGIALVLVLSVVKEKFLDSVFDGKDIAAAAAGCGVSAIIFALIELLNKVF